ncbi:hypothetical protein L596_010209 [Steinernema carpocapsae]|uniref:Uncharacterized protein n=1 Tax=Steinernema carpocapsae TaxID=34508 RepID=A0A4U5PHV7_STECR|nr:hypothetical protein L596_010209 [Steinernema carpocapsae]
MGLFCLDKLLPELQLSVPPVLPLEWSVHARALGAWNLQHLRHRFSRRWSLFLLFHPAIHLLHFRLSHNVHRSVHPRIHDAASCQHPFEFRKNESYDESHRRRRHSSHEEDELDRRLL